MLVGFMGTGKTTIGKELARRLNFTFIDTDERIERKTGLTVNDIFKEYGEKYFRRLEHDLIREISLFNRCIISTGGGVVLNVENIKLLKQRGVIVCLKADYKYLLKRLKAASNRPLLAGENIYEKIPKLLKEREQYYKCADIYINIENKTVSEITDEIIKDIERI
ncbi:MAG: shikimate kinase [Mahellales bacterium]